MADLDETAMAKLAREMAINIRNYKDIFADFGITEEDYYEVCKIDFFKRCKEQFALEWNSAMSAADRVKLTSATAAEQILPIVTRRALDPHEPLVNVLGTFKQVCQNAGIGDPKAEQKPSERFVITINLGADTEHYNKSVAIDANDISPTPEEIAQDRALSTSIKTKAFKGNDNGKTDNEVSQVPSIQQLRPPGEGNGA